MKPYDWETLETKEDPLPKKQRAEGQNRQRPQHQHPTRTAEELRNIQDQKDTAAKIGEALEQVTMTKK